MILNKWIHEASAQLNLQWIGSPKSIKMWFKEVKIA